MIGRDAWSRLGFALLGFGMVATGAEAAETIDLYRNTRTQVMGGAAVAIVEDESSLFQNPAAMAGSQDIKLHYAIVDGEVGTAGLADALGGTLLSGSSSGISSMIGKNVYGRVQATPTLLMPNFGVSMILDGQYAFYSKNKALPTVTVGYQSTMGLQAAFGHSFHASTRPNRRTSEFRVGIGGKVLWRRGGYYPLDTVELIDLTQRTTAKINELVGSYEMGIGIDLGAQYMTKVADNAKLYAGVAFLDIGDTSFKTMASPIQGDLAMGLGYKIFTDSTTVTFAYDFRNILDSMDWRKKSHLGFEVAFPGLSLQGGIYQAFLSYGVGFDLWLFKIYAGSYATELSDTMHLDPDRRWIIRMSLDVAI